MGRVSTVDRDMHASSTTDSRQRKRPLSGILTLLSSNAHTLSFLLFFFFSFFFKHAHPFLAHSLFCFHSLQTHPRDEAVRRMGSTKISVLLILGPGYPYLLTETRKDTLKTPGPDSTAI